MDTDVKMASWGYMDKTFPLPHSRFQTLISLPYSWFLNHQNWSNHLLGRPQLINADSWPPFLLSPKLLDTQQT